MPRRPIPSCVLVAGALLLASVPAPAAPPVGPVFELSDMTYVASEGPVNEVVLDAKTAQVFPAQNEAHLQDVHAHLQAPGDNSGAAAQTTRLDYNRSEGLVTTDQPVVIQDETGTYRGGGFRYYVRENRFRLVGGAEVLQEP
jgi:LPS export ABC transporter protein LptC